MSAGARWEQQYNESVGPQIAAVVVAAQVAATREADVYTADVLNELGFGPRATPGVLRHQSLAGVSGAGLPVEDLLGQAVAHAGQRYNDLRRMQVPVGDAGALTVTRAPDLELASLALEDTRAFVDGLVDTILTDTMRAAEEAAMAERTWVAGWVRMAEPGACARCIVLSGKFYAFNEGFLRHPRCRCTHLPAPDGRTRDGKRALDRLIALESPDAHFEALTAAEQDRAFGVAGAQAIRDGADISRVVNARRGMSRAQDTGRMRRVRVDGRDVYVTTTGTTRRGRTPGQTRGARLMPESILEIAAGDVDERIRLLRLHGYIT